MFHARLGEGPYHLVRGEMMDSTILQVQLVGGGIPVVFYVKQRIWRMKRDLRTSRLLRRIKV